MRNAVIRKKDMFMRAFLTNPVRIVLDEPQQGINLASLDEVTHWNIDPAGFTSATAYRGKPWERYIASRS